MSNQAAPLMEELKESVADLGRTAANKINANRKAAAGGLEKASAAIDEKAGRVSELAHATAGKLKTTARYLRKRDVHGMLVDMGSGVKNHAGSALAVAAAVGFLLGRAFMSND